MWTRIWPFLTISPIFFFLDWITKKWIVDHFQLGESQPVWTDVFDLTHVLNPAAAFGFLSSLPDSIRQPFFMIMPVVAVFLIALYVRKLPDDAVLQRIGFSLVVSGALGNLLDRFLYGSVVDFLLIHWKTEWYYPAFNVADIAITFGVGLLLIDNFTQSRSAPKGQ